MRTTNHLRYILLATCIGVVSGVSANTLLQATAANGNELLHDKTAIYLPIVEVVSVINIVSVDHEIVVAQR